MEDHIKNEITELMEEMDKSKGQSINAHKLLMPSMSNNIAALVYGHRFDYSDPKRILLDRVIQRLARYLGQTGLLAFFPTVAHICSQLRIFGFAQLREAMDDFQDFNE